MTLGDAAHLIVGLCLGWSTARIVHQSNRTHEGGTMNDPDFLADGDPGVPEHERVGPLPRGMEARVRNAGRPRCGRRTNGTGRPCRTIVLDAGLACPSHDGMPLSWTAGR